MSVEWAREQYRWWSSGGLKHMATCPFTDHPFHAYIERQIDALSIASDLAVAESIHGRGTPTATRLAAHDLAIREGIAW